MNLSDLGSIGGGKAGDHQHDGNSVMVGCAIVDSVFGVSPGALALLVRLLKLCFKLEGISATECGGVNRPSAYAACLFRVSANDRNGALRKISQELGQDGIIAGCIEAAYFCEAELCWRTVLGQGQFFEIFKGAETKEAMEEIAQRLTGVNRPNQR